MQVDLYNSYATVVTVSTFLWMEGFGRLLTKKLGFRLILVFSMNAL